MTTQLLLLLAILSLIVGPALIQSGGSNRGRLALMDGFALVAVGGLAILHMLPESLRHGGIIAGGCAVVGVLLPVLADRIAHSAGGRLSAVLLLLGLLPHAAMESAVLALSEPGMAMGVGVAIAAHRLPVGLVVFSQVSCLMGVKFGWMSIFLIVLVTILGFFTGDALTQSLSGAPLYWLQALVGGTLLHVVISHRLHQGSHVHSHNHTNEDAHRTPYVIAGAVLGLGLVIGTIMASHNHPQEPVHNHEH